MLPLVSCLAVVLLARQAHCSACCSSAGPCACCPDADSGPLASSRPRPRPMFEKAIGWSVHMYIDLDAIQVSTGEGGLPEEGGPGWASGASVL